MRNKIMDMVCKHISSVIDHYDAFLFDLWGVVIKGNHTYPGVVDHINYLIQQTDKKVFFLTNAPNSASYLLPFIQSWGMHATEQMVISSGALAVDMLLNSGQNFGIDYPSIYHLGYQNDLLDGHPIATTTDIDAADMLLLTLSCATRTDLDLDKIDALLATVVQRNIMTLCANPDIGFMEEGMYIYCAGYFARKIKELGGTIAYAGKPYPAIYQKIFDQLPLIPKHRILMIGDTFHTDILGANQVGIDSALVLTGNATKLHSPYDTLEEKLVHIKIAAMEQAVMPNFVIQLGK